MQEDNIVGLGMSGGGFRASLYHLGTLSVLAEVDALRHIEVISTVSGGSIFGVHFFLRLRMLLQSKADEVNRVIVHLAITTVLTTTSSSQPPCMNMKQVYQLYIGN
mgnify:CR=1 FL=1